MKNIVLICIFTFITGISSVSVLATNDGLLRGENIIDDIDAKSRDLVIGDQVYGVSEHVAVHSEFIQDDYFSRLRIGMKVRFTYQFHKDIHKKIINEIWVLKSN